MIPKSGYRFSEKIMLHQNARALIDSYEAVGALAARFRHICSALACDPLPRI
jgi:hypothetical protein